MTRPFVDITPLQTAHRQRGIGAYVRGVLTGFEAIGAGVTTWGFEGEPDRPWPAAEEAVPRVTRRHGASRIQLGLWGHRSVPDGALLHFMSDLVAEVRVRGPYLATAHDLIPAMWPDRYQAGPIRRLLYRSYLRHLRGASHLVTHSEAVRQDVASRLDYDLDRITVVPPGVPQLPEPDGLGYEGDGPYLFVTGTSEFHKNVSFVIETMATIPFEQRAPLVATGMGPELWDELHDLAHSLGVELVHLGYVSRQELSNLYAGAAAVLVPSLYEGFGLPALEALQVGAPVITSDRGALPEALGDVGEVLGLERELWRQRILDALAGELDHDTEAGRVRARGFTWERAARRIVSIYEGLGASTSR